MPADLIDRHLAKLRRRDEISPEEERAIRAVVTNVRQVPADRVLIRRGVELSESTLLLEGMLCRFKDFRDGRRQLLELHVPGDFVDLHSFTLKRLDHEVMSLTPCWIATASHADLRRITEQHPHLTRIYWFATNMDAAIQREWTMSLGRRDAVARIAHLFCELYVRLEVVGLTRGYEFDCPLTQADIAEYAGLTPVHVNRTLQKLRRQEVIRFERKVLTICDWAELQRIAEFDPSYLYLERKER